MAARRVSQVEHRQCRESKSLNDNAGNLEGDNFICIAQTMTVSLYNEVKQESIH